MLSADNENDSDVLALTGAGAALALSEMPVEKTVAAVRVGLVDGQFIVNPTFPQRKTSKLDLIVAGTRDGIVMVEAGANEVTEDEAITALETAHTAIKQLVEMIDALAKEAGRTKLAEARDQGQRRAQGLRRPSPTRALADAMRIKGKLVNYATVAKVEKEMLAGLPEAFAGQQARSQGLLPRQRRNARCARKCSARASARTAASSTRSARSRSRTASCPASTARRVFTRGETQALVTATLGTADDQQKIEMVDGETWKRFMLHYNFPPFSVGEVKPMRGPGRREIGHGALAERSLAPMIPAETDFAYTIRIVSDILESNGSSSMASVCGGSLAMMDAGVPIKAPVAGVAMGLIMDEKTGKYAVLSDIAGAEDHYGDMDFKVAGTANGITALQMDIKISGVSAQVMREALAQAKAGRLLHPRQDDGVARRRTARTCRPTRRASSPSRSPSTRSATSSAPAAR